MHYRRLVAEKINAYEMLPGLIFALFMWDMGHGPGGRTICHWRKRMPALSRVSQMKNYSLRLVLISVVLATVTTALYWPVQSFDFVNYDDDVLVRDNRRIRDGLSKDGLLWAFTTFEYGNWHPLTWVSHMGDVEVYDLNAGGHHRTNALIHTASAVLLFLVFAGMTRSVETSGLVAVLFAIHPLHVESVAWVAERKDVLSGLFWVLTIGVYAWYVRQPTALRYLLAVLSFTMGLLSKPMVVTLPFVLLLLDYWPLQRLPGVRTVFNGQMSTGGTSMRDAVLRLVMEKIPLFLLSAVSSVLTIVAQKEVGAVWTVDKMPIDVRLANALASYAEYIRKTLWPVDLAVLYPHTGMPEAWKIGVSVLLLGSVTVLAIRKMRKMPFMLVGWLWYLGTLVPVIGIVQVGSQAMADRYTYIPLIGLFIAVAWGAERLIAERSRWKIPFIVSSLAVLSVLMILARSQVETWQSSLTLFEQALTATKVNPLAHHNIGAYYLEKNDCQRAVPHFLEAIRMKENYAYPYDALGVCASRRIPPTGALYFFAKALEIDPRLTKAMVDRGILLMKQGKFNSAAEDFRHALRIKPNHEVAHANLGLILLHAGDLVNAEVHLREARRVNPDSAEVLNNLGILCMKQGRTEEASAWFRKALELMPSHPEIESNLRILSKAGGH
jgi:Flp pilus assembly protein TadD